MLKTKKVILILLCLSLIGKLIGFYRDVTITSYLGFGEQTDALLLAISIPTVIFSAFQTSIRTTFVPIFSKKYEDNKNECLREFNYLNFFLIILMIAGTIISYFQADLLIKIIAPGLKAEAFNLTVYYLKFSVLLILTYGIFNITTGFLQSIRIFSTVETAGIFNNITIVAVIYLLFNKIGALSVIYGFLIGSFVQIIISYLTLKMKTNYLFMQIKAQNDVIKKFFSLTKYVFVGSTLTQISVLSDKFFASFLTPGSISALHYANLLKNLPLTIIVLTLTNVLFPNMAISYKKNNSHFISLVEEQMKFVVYTTLFISIAFISYSNEIIKIVFYRGNFNNQDLTMTSISLAAYSLGIVFWAIKEVLGKISYAIEDTRTPTVISLISVIINLAFNYIFIQFWGFVGIALSTSLSFLINSGVLYIILVKKKNINFSRSIKNTILYWFLVSGLIFVINELFHYVITKYIENEYILLSLGVIFLGVVYYGVGTRFGFNYLRMLVKGEK